MTRRSRDLIVVMAALGLLICGARSSAGSPPPLSQPAAAASSPEPPEALFKDLFDAVQMAPLYPDSKLFADAVPRSSPADILAEYRAAHLDSAVALRRFVEDHFTLPSAVNSAPAESATVSIVQHIDGLWDLLTRRTPDVPAFGSLLPLPQPYVVPGGRFREIYYWDSYFTMLGLAESGRHDLVESMVRDFAYLIDTYGHVPNGTRSYYLTRSQPPFFSPWWVCCPTTIRPPLLPATCRSCNASMGSGWRVAAD